MKIRITENKENLKRMCLPDEVINKVAGKVRVGYREDGTTIRFKSKYKSGKPVYWWLDNNNNLFPTYSIINKS